VLVTPEDPSLLDGLRRLEAESDARLAGGETRLGWKAGFGTAAAMAKLGTSGPLAGFLTETTLGASGATFDVSDWAKPVLEPEVAVRLAADIEAGADRSQIAAAVGAVGAAIELVDLGAAGDDPGAMLAANLFHRAVLLGDLAPLAPGNALADVRVDVRSAGADHALGADPAAVLGDLIDVLASMASLLAPTSYRLRAGDVIITGAAVPPFMLEGGEEVDVRVGDSRVSARVA